MVSAVGLAGCASSAPQPGAPGGAQEWPVALAMQFGRFPDSTPQRWRGLIGEYGADSTRRWYILERDRRLWALDHRGNYVPLAEKTDSLFEAPVATAAISGEVRFSRDETGRAISVQVGDMVVLRNRIEPPSGANQLRITPVRPIETLRAEALAAKPPAESGSFRQPDLVDLQQLDTTFRYDIRYAGTNNFLGARIYDQSRAFLQRPAAEALARANTILKRFGLAILVHDAYRPWYVTKIFWDATPDSVRWLVANPAQGSRHNRGSAVDVTLVDFESGRVVEMPSTYDETTRRARADYPGGTSQQRWYREFLRRTLEHEGFTVNPLEWWHFDYKDWRAYPIMNVPFEQVRPAPARPSGR
ncbi:MAG: M15 family metallopeptidase [Gemmatimonadaceae bacterium]